jgi:NAD+ synthase (glutamine-hydrolysing)
VDGYPIGDLLFDVGGIGIGFEICEDAWVAKRPGAALSLQGVDVILNPSASHFAFDKHEVRKRFVLEGSRAFGVTYVYSNLLGNEAGRIIFDGGTLIATGGRMVALGPRFSFRQQMLTTAAIDVDATRMGQARTGSFRPDVSDSSGARVPVDFQWPAMAPERCELQVEPWEKSEQLKEEEFTRAEALGLFDYLRKSRSDGFVISLSGGADSSACACLISMMAELSCAELGLDAVLQRLRLQGPRSVRELVRKLLLCVYQSTRNSGAVTRSAAAVVAEAAGAGFLVLDVEPIVSGYTQLISAAIGRELSWESDDIPLQNIQARARAPSAWMLANLRNAILLATSNRSEAAVGYATMDGDTSGGLSPIGGIDKNFLRRYLRWLESTGPHGLRPIPALQAVNAQEPTAELRPMGTHQTDEEDLMPYDLLDAVERAAIRDKLLPVEVFQRMRLDFPQYGVKPLASWIERFFRLWCRNQWKRERYAPSFHLDDENLDPKTWCRFPILSGGFEKELRDLRAVAEELPA